MITPIILNVDEDSIKQISLEQFHNDIVERNDKIQKIYLENKPKLIKTLNINSGQQSFDANPHFYDYICRLELNFDDKYFEFVKGGCQVIYPTLIGTFEATDDTITLNFTEEIDKYNDERKPFKLKNVIKYKLIEQEKQHFNGYCFSKSHLTLILSKNILNINKEIDIQEPNDDPFINVDDEKILYSHLININKECLLGRIQADIVNYVNNEKLHESINRIKNNFNNFVSSEQSITFLKKIYFNEELLLKIIEYNRNIIENSYVEDFCPIFVDKNNIILINNDYNYGYQYENGKITSEKMKLLWITDNCIFITSTYPSLEYKEIDYKNNSELLNEFWFNERNVNEKTNFNKFVEYINFLFDL